MGSSLSLQSAVDIISRWQSTPADLLIFDCGHNEAAQYLQAFDRIRQSDTRGEHSRVVVMAVARLQKEFQTILTRQTNLPTVGNSTTDLSSITDTTFFEFRHEDYVAFDLPSKQVLEYLRSVAERLDSAGNLGDCIKIYKSIRKPFVDTIAKQLRLEELAAGDTKKCPKDELKMKIELWTRAAKVCVKILLTREKMLCQHIFNGLGTPMDGRCFLETIKDAAEDLFTFVEAVSLTHHPPERMEMILMLYEALSALLPDVDALFNSESSSAIRNSASNTLSRLGSMVRRMLSDFENTILDEESTASDGVTIHPLTKYVMDYINVIVRHKKLLANLIVSKPSMNLADRAIPDGELGELNDQFPLALHLKLIFDVLLHKLDIKSKSYKDASLGHLFVMNNVHYVVQRVGGSVELQEIIGEVYVKKLHENVNYAMSCYKKLTCDKLLCCLSEEGLYVTWCFSSRVSESSLSGRIKTFNAAFEEFQEFQSMWAVPDSRFREELQQYILEKLIPAYEQFLRKFRNHIDREEEGKTCFKLSKKTPIKFSVDDLKAFVIQSFL